jgi:elongation factor P
MLAKDIKPGAVVVYNDAPCMISSMSVQSPSARGAATLYKFRARILVAKTKVDITLKGTDTLPEADFQRRNVKFMYAEPTQVHFLDQADYNQYSLDTEIVEDERPYMTEELEGMIAMIYNDECVGIMMPTTVALKVIECDPAVKGDSATKRTKAAKLETGLIVQVPEYLTQGETIKVDTRTGEFLSRA